MPTEVLADFEAAAAEGRRALDVTGEDVAAYCDARLGGGKPYDRYVDKWRAPLNEKVKQQL